ncbi:TPA: hypothetical protein TZW74_000700 [Streptococcus suis]|nr:hypothetical protein [Streptococcus suis]
MRTDVNILWLEDKPKSPAHKGRVKDVEDYLRDRGYNPQVELIKNLSEAREYLVDPHRMQNRIDFFISDFDLGNGQNSLEFLTEIRKVKKYKQFFILYSNNRYEMLKSRVLEMLTSEKDFKLFSNFSFVSLESADRAFIKSAFEELIDLGLTRWDEINAIRGMYMSEHASIEYKIRQKFRDSSSDYHDLIERFCYEHNVPEIEKNRWINQKNIRNALAHVSGEKYLNTNGRYSRYIESLKDNNIKIFEDKLDIHRKDLIMLINFLRENYKL